MATPRKQRAGRATSPTKISRQAALHGNGAAPLAPELLQRLYYYLLKCRLVEERARLLFRQGTVAENYRAAMGREATEVGATIDLQPADTVASSHPSFIANIMKGMPLQHLYAQLYAGKSSPDRMRSSRAHLGCASMGVVTPTSAIAAQLDIGPGVALANKQKKPSIVVALWGEVSSSLGFCNEALKFAAVHKLPTVHVLENNSWPDSVPANENLSLKAQAYGFPVITVDGNDVVAVYRVCHEAGERARQGFGPTLVECKISRGQEHDPILLMERNLQKQRLWSDDWKQEQANSINAEIDEAIAVAESSLEA